MDAAPCRGRCCGRGRNLRLSRPGAGNLLSLFTRGKSQRRDRIAQGISGAVWAAVSKEALAMIFTGADATGFEEDARLTAMWLWTLSTPTARYSRLLVTHSRLQTSSDYNPLMYADTRQGHTSKVSKGRSNSSTCPPTRPSSTRRSTSGGISSNMSWATSAHALSASSPTGHATVCAPCSVAIHSLPRSGSKLNCLCESVRH